MNPRTPTCRTYSLVFELCSTPLTRDFDGVCMHTYLGRNFGIYYRMRDLDAGSTCDTNSVISTELNDSLRLSTRILQGLGSPHEAAVSFKLKPK